MKSGHLVNQDTSWLTNGFIRLIFSSRTKRGPWKCQGNDRETIWSKTLKPPGTRILCLSSHTAIFRTSTNSSAISHSSILSHCTHKALYYVLITFTPIFFKTHTHIYVWVNIYLRIANPFCTIVYDIHINCKTYCMYIHHGKSYAPSVYSVSD